MTFGATLFRLRREAGLSQEELADRLDVTRQTISKWEMDLSTPDLPRLQAMSRLFGVSYETLIGASGADPTDWNASEAMSEQIDWTAAWAGRYPILAAYPHLHGIEAYAERMAALFADCRAAYGLTDQDTMLVLKDLLYQHYKARRTAK